MTVYAVAHIHVKNREEYEKYSARFMDVFSKFNGKLLAADFNAKAVMGEWNGDRLVIVEFPNAGEFKAWATSPEYLEIAKHRIAGADVTTVLAEALTGSP